ncbi:hypothetical protein EBI_26489 [Enterocytozoon bieneusi H348]|nr:hypothetical protein EBI_26489 [Enterocytozoon bieneusi H348]|eukprot:XP_002651186.1 hypothetical protein EBI_26489 [Enterocytozoon bieneusi H348]
MFKKKNHQIFKKNLKGAREKKKILSLTPPKKPLNKKKNFKRGPKKF